MVEQKVVVQNETGLHARPASLLIEAANNYSAEVQLVYKNQEVNAKSVMRVMSLGIGQGAEVTIRAEGNEEEDAVEELVELIKSGFGE
ncbi:HPr family phosphocarrier protein [Sporohalobacter salinus]|uniref:HPr family phosphocarrier protein n=1 Tax=Sporohalobacter salinus TaxID=1494606 RepID=UPI0019620B0A|nr:HPr family phosphocarrier protein [Sporohalobacter salinus]MBM7624579.1 phosphocarrier protein [Sporohalobacter salinus]